MSARATGGLTQSERYRIVVAAIRAATRAPSALDFPCRYCGAAEGEPCAMRVAREPYPFHDARYRRDATAREQYEDAVQTLADMLLFDTPRPAGASGKRVDLLLREVQR